MINVQMPYPVRQSNVDTFDTILLSLQPGCSNRAFFTIKKARSRERALALQLIFCIEVVTMPGASR